MVSKPYPSNAFMPKRVAPPRSIRLRQVLADIRRLCNFRATTPLRTARIMGFLDDQGKNDPKVIPQPGADQRSGCRVAVRYTNLKPPARWQSTAAYCPFWGDR